MSSHPRDAFVSPRFARPATFMRLPSRTDLTGVDVVGCDLVEVSPPFDGPGQITSLLAANLLFEMLCVIAKRRDAAAG